MRNLAVLVILIFSGSVAQVNAGSKAVRLIDFHHINRPELINFALPFFAAVPGSLKATDKDLRTSIKEDGFFAEADLDGDGVPELFLQINDRNWCGENGCVSFIFKKSTQGYGKICLTLLAERDINSLWKNKILSDKENGYHRIDTGYAVVRWNSKEDSSGNWCKADYGNYVPFHKVDNPEIRGFVTAYLRDIAPDLSENKVQDIIKKDFEYADIDINDDGIPERFLLLEAAEWCGTGGCTAAIFKRTQNGFQKICSASLFEGARILSQKENGYHRLIATPSVIRWRASASRNDHEWCDEDDVVWANHYNKSPYEKVF